MHSDELQFRWEKEGQHPNESLVSFLGQLFQWIRRTELIHGI